PLLLVYDCPTPMDRDERHQFFGVLSVAGAFVLGFIGTAVVKSPSTERRSSITTRGPISLCSWKERFLAACWRWPHYLWCCTCTVVAIGESLYVETPGNLEE